MKNKYGIPPFKSPEGWAKKEKRSLVVKGKKVIGIKVETETQRFVIPVADVRDGEDRRKVAEFMEKQVNQSKFIKPSFSVLGYSYNVSRKMQ